MSVKRVTDTQKPFAEHGKKAVKGITSLCLPAKDVLIEPDDINAFPRIKNTLQTHMIKRFFDKQNIPYLQFFKMATHDKLVFIQFYGKGAWGYQKIVADNIVVHVLETMNQLNGFRVQDARFGSIATVSLIDNER